MVERIPSDDARKRLDFKRNPPANAIGFESSGSNMGTPFGPSAGGSPAPFGAPVGGPPSPFGPPKPFGAPAAGAPSPFGPPAAPSLSPSPFGAPAGGISGGNPFARPMGTPFGAAPQPATKKPSEELAELLAKGSIGGLKASWEMTKILSKDVKKNTSVEWNRFFFLYMEVSAVLLSVGLVFSLLSIKFTFLGFGLPMLQGAAGSLLISGLGWLAVFPKAKAKVASGYSHASATPTPTLPTPTSPPPTPFQFPSDVDDDFEGDDDDLDNEDDFEEEELDEEPESVDVKSLVNSLPTVTPGTQTRSFLYEQASHALGTITRNFAKSEDISEGDDDFVFYNEILEEACEINGVKEDDLPDLMSVTETMFVIKLRVRITPSVSSKLDKIVREFESLFQRDEQGNLEFPNAFCTHEQFGSQAIIWAFKAEESQSMVSIKDTYSNQSVASFVKNSANLFPVVFGVSPQGEPYYADLAKAESIIMSGLARKGKSWLVRAILDQIATYASPKQVHFYIGDPKDEISEFVNYNLPHVARKEFTAEGTLNMLKHLCYSEADRRRKLFNDHGVNKISDFHKKAPDVEMPYIYIILDEMMSMQAYMKDQGLAADYASILSVITSQLPAVGIRGVFIAHRVKEPTIPKSVYSLIDFRFSVGAPADGIKEAIGLQAGEKFPYKTNQVGDLAFRVPTLNGSQSGNPVFARAVVLGKDATSLDDYEFFIKHLWSQLEPGYKATASVSTSLGSARDRASSNEPVHSLASSVEGEKLLRRSDPVLPTISAEEFAEITQDTEDDSEDAADFWLS